MSLQVWLPLNGDSYNQGLCKNITFPNTLTFSSNGKIGEKCLNSYTGWFSVPSMDNKKQMSFSYWIKINEGTTTDWLDIFSWQTTDGTNSVTSRQELYYYNKNGNTNAMTTGVWYASGSGTNATSNSGHSQQLIGEWIHYTFTINYTTGETNFYINGILQKTNQTAGTNHYIKTGNIFRLRESALNCSINDFRLYNHCLSAKEVEEISKGLILHYKLNNNGLGNPNLVKGNYSAITTATTNNISGTLSFDTSIIALNDLKGKTLYFSYDYSVEGAKLYNNTGDYTKDRYGIHGNLSYVDSSGTTKTTYPFAGYLTASGTGRAIQSYIIPADAKQINSLTFGLQPFNKPAANSTATWYIKNCKLEIGQSTSYTPNQNDIHQDSSIIYDSSGYNNNGQIIGSLEIIVPSPRYDCATHIPATSSKIHISNFLTSGFSNSYSFAWWGKRDSNNPMFWGFSDGIRLNGMYLGNLWNTGDGSNNPLYKIGTTTQVSVPSVNVWHHYVMVGNGSKCYVYLDGELWAEAKTYKAISGTSIYINGWDTGTSYCSNNTDILDFRIYATALTEAQVKELYRNSMNINGTNILPRDLE